MTLSGGFYARGWNKKQPPTEKHWQPISGRSRVEHGIGQFIEYCKDESLFENWLTKCKQYGAEYYDED